MRLRATFPILVLLSAGCPEPTVLPDASVAADAAPVDSSVPASPCDVLDPDQCLLPWPSSHFLRGEGSSRRVSIPVEAMPRSEAGTPIDPGPWNRLDGFSPMTTMMARLRGTLDASSLPGWRDPSSSLTASSPTVLLDVTTGERVLHFAEVEPASEDPTRTVLYLRPAQRLAEGHHFVVAIRDVRDAAGMPMVPEPAFAALRDEDASASAAVRARQPSFSRDVLAPLETAGVARSGLVLAWDFWTASGAAITSDLVAMRDLALGTTAATPTCTVTSTTEMELDPRLLRRIEGTFSAPSFIDATGRIARDAMGRPIVAGTREVPFVALVPRSAEGASAGSVKALFYGHGLFNSGAEVDQGFVHDLLTPEPMIAFGVELSGLAEGDILQVAPVLGNDLSGFEESADRILDGVVGYLVFPRALAACAALPELAVGGTAVLDPASPRYYGISQGAIFGPTLAALSPDIERFVLDGGGIAYPLMLPRSTDWPTFESVLSGAYASPLTRQLAMVMFSVHWDRFEGATFAPDVASGRWLDESAPARRILYQVGLEDEGTPVVSAEIAARTLGLRVVAGSASSPVGLVAAGASDRLGYAAFDYGVPRLPDGPVVPEVNCVHESIRRDPAAQAQLLAFFRTGTLAAPALCGATCTGRPLHACR